MITYNHQDYIAEAIESILKQETNFSIQLIIGEDCSKDATREICADYANKFPDKVKLITSTTNVGMMENFLRVYKACKGKYVAICEGDDYWTDTLKLQKQVDFLEANPGYSGCFHKVKIKVERNGENFEWVMHDSFTKDTFGTEDVLGPWFIASPSFVFVNYEDFELPDWFFNCRFGDLPFMLLLTLRGQFKLLNEFMAVYRQHDEGMSIVYKVYDKVMVMIYIYASFDIYTHYKHHESIRKSVMFEIDTHIPPKQIPKVKLKIKLVNELKKYYHTTKKIFLKN